MKVQCCSTAIHISQCFFSRFISLHSWSIYFSWTPCTKNRFSAIFNPSLIFQMVGVRFLVYYSWGCMDIPHETYLSEFFFQNNYFELLRNPERSTEHTTQHLQYRQFLRWPHRKLSGGLRSELLGGQMPVEMTQSSKKVRKNSSVSVEVCAGASTWWNQQSLSSTSSRAINWVTITQNTSGVTVDLKKLAQWSVSGRWRTKRRAFPDGDWFPDTGGGFHYSKIARVDVAGPVKPGLFAEKDVIKRSDRPTIGIEEPDDPVPEIHTPPRIRRQQVLNQCCAIRT